MPESSPVPGTARGARATGMLEFRDYLHMVRRYWVMVLVLTCLGVGAGVAATVLITPRYEATTELYVSVLGEQQGTEDLVRGSDFARKSVASYVRVATSDSVLDPVIAELGLAETGRELADDVEARAPKDTSMVAITVTKDDPMLAARIADAIGASLTRVVETQLEGANPDVGQAAVGPVRLTTVQPASPPQYPVAPRPVVNLAAGLLGGLLLGIGMAVLRAMLDTRLHTADDIAEITDTPVVGEIAFDKHAKRSPLIVHTPGLNPRAESFKALRTNLRFLATGSSGPETGRCIVFTSGSPAEGKSTTSANLAISLAEAGASVVLIDGDLRRPRIAEHMGIEGGVGLTDVLIGQREPWEVIQRWGSHGLHVLPSGAVPPNPSELLEAPEMGELIEELAKQFQFVLIDAPPVLLTTDASVISKYTDSVVYLVAAGSTRKRALDDGLRVLATGGARVWGIVLSMVPQKNTRAYGYGDYSARPPHDQHGSSSGARSSWAQRRSAVKKGSSDSSSLVEQRTPELPVPVAELRQRM